MEILYSKGKKKKKRKKKDSKNRTVFSLIAWPILSDAMTSSCDLIYFLYALHTSAIMCSKGIMCYVTVDYTQVCEHTHIHTHIHTNTYTHRINSCHVSFTIHNTQTTAEQLYSTEHYQGNRHWETCHWCIANNMTCPWPNKPITTGSNNDIINK